MPNQRIFLRLSLISLTSLAACAASPSDAPPPLATPAAASPSIPPPTLPDPLDAGASIVADAGTATGAPPTMKVTPLAFDGVTPPVGLDLIAYEPSASRVWIPVASLGKVYVLDTAKQTFAHVDGFATKKIEEGGKTRTRGPSAAAVGDGVVYVSDRASQEICTIDTTTLKTVKCLKIKASGDAVAYMASAKELWVTTPDDHAILVFDASKPKALKAKAKVTTDGESECTAADEAHGLFFTNYEDKNVTAVIDVQTHKVQKTWALGCGSDGPRGIAFDSAHGFAIVACTDHLEVLDAAHDGAKLGTLATGAGVDAIDLRDGKVYVQASKAAKLTVATVDDKGQLTVVATADTAVGARNAVADTHGNAYVVDARGARVLAILP